jgi:HD-GYP domain-containing protein (c-di-GMP phosphodiesterase class II)
MTQRVRIYPSRSAAELEVESLSHQPEKEIEPPKDWLPEKDLSEALSEVIRDGSLQPDLKARVVYHHSVGLMERLFDNPTAEFIGKSKKAIAAIADLILDDDDTSRNLLKITTHDFYTYTHSVNVGILSIYLAKRLYGPSSGHDLHELGAAFFLHDLGKVRVDPAIINKPGRLTEEEMSKMRIHPYQSYKILEESGHLSHECKVITMQHHEREDGSGYPRRLKGDEIHDYARICCIADVYDALTAVRSYKKALSPFDALKVMKEEMIGFFHAEIFRNFVLLFS